MTRCIKCEAVIPQMDCKNCPPMLKIPCPKCRTMNKVPNEYHLQRGLINATI